MTLNRSQINEINISAYDDLADAYNQRNASASDVKAMIAMGAANVFSDDEFPIWHTETSDYSLEIYQLDELLRIRKKPPFRAMDIGCGAGGVLSYMEHKGFNTVGIDLSPKMCELAKQNSPKSIIRQGDIMEWDFLKQTFNVITMMSLLCQLSPMDAQTLLGRIATRWLKPGGLICASTSIEPDNKSGLITKQTVGYHNLGQQTTQRFRTNYTEADFIKLIQPRFEILMKFVLSDPKKISKRKFQSIIARVR